MVMRETLRWMLSVLRRGGERGSCRGSGGERRFDRPYGDLFHRNGSTHAKKRMSGRSNEKRVDANLDKVIFEQLHAEDVNHRCEARSAQCPSVREPFLVKFKLSSTLCFTHPHTRPSIFIFTTMSNVIPEGRREDALVKQRNLAREEYERQKQQLINETEKARPSAHRFVGQNDSMEDSLKYSTVGLVKLEDFQQKRKELEEAKAREAARTDVLK